MSDLPDVDSLHKTKEKKKLSPADEMRAKSYGVGCVMFIVGVGMVVGFFYLGQAPAKLFYMLASGAVVMLLSGIGLFIHPLNKEQMENFQNNPNPISTFKIMPVFWKVWLLVILAAMLGACLVVFQLIERVR
jgi:hypothetical protein